MGSWRECTRILGLEGFRVRTITWAGEGPTARVLLGIERRGIRGYECSGYRRRTWRLRDQVERTWGDLPWAEPRDLGLSATTSRSSDVRHSHRADHLCRSEAAHPVA